MFVAVRRKLQGHVLNALDTAAQTRQRMSRERFDCCPGFRVCVCGRQSFNLCRKIRSVCLYPSLAHCSISCWLIGKWIEMRLLDQLVEVCAAEVYSLTLSSSPPTPRQSKAWLGGLSGPPTSGAASSPISSLTWRSSGGATNSSPTTTAFWAPRRWTWCWPTSPWTSTCSATRPCLAARPSAFVKPWWTPGCSSPWASEGLGGTRSEPALRTAAAAYTGSWTLRPAPRRRWLTPTLTPPRPSRAAMTRRAWTGTRTATVRPVKGTHFTFHFWLAVNPIWAHGGWVPGFEEKHKSAQRKSKKQSEPIVFPLWSDSGLTGCWLLSTVQTRQWLKC